MTMWDPQEPSLLIDAVRHSLKAECITGHEDTQRRIAIVADHLPVLINILDDLQRLLKGQPVRAPTHVLPSPFGGVSEAFGGPTQGWLCCDKGGERWMVNPTARKLVRPAIGPWSPRTSWPST